MPIMPDSLTNVTLSDNWYRPRMHTWPYTTYVPESAQPPSIQRFCGAVKAIENLPRKSASIGDAYYVEQQGILVVRVSSGWHHFDTN